MSGPALYDEDILLWSEEQAELIRRLGRTRRDLPNELDIENVAEEVESVGRSELAAVESYIELILSHLIKLSTEGDSDAARHWRAEIIGFHGNMRRRYTASMRQRIGLSELWTSAREQAVAASAVPDELSARLPVACPVTLDGLLRFSIDFPRLLSYLADASQGQ
jgi:hypothetical protein